MSELFSDAVQYPILDPKAAVLACCSYEHQDILVLLSLILLSFIGYDEKCRRANLQRSYGTNIYVMHVNVYVTISVDLNDPGV